MPILPKEKITECLQRYYLEHCGEKETDIWYEQPAVNVWVFARGEKLITLHCHILTGVVTEYVEDKQD